MTLIPNLILDNSIQPWLVFGSFYNGIKLGQLNKSLLKVQNPEKWFTAANRKSGLRLPSDKEILSSLTSLPAKLPLKCFLFINTATFIIFLFLLIIAAGERRALTK